MKELNKFWTRRPGVSPFWDSVAKQTYQNQEFRLGAHSYNLLLYCSLGAEYPSPKKVNLLIIVGL